MRNVLAYVGKSGRRVVSALIATAFAQEMSEAMARCRRPERPKVPKLATIMDDAEPPIAPLVPTLRRATATTRRADSRAEVRHFKSAALCSPYFSSRRYLAQTAPPEVVLLSTSLRRVLSGEKKVSPLRDRIAYS